MNDANIKQNQPEEPAVEKTEPKSQVSGPEVKVKKTEPKIPDPEVKVKKTKSKSQVSDPKVKSGKNRKLALKLTAIAVIFVVTVFAVFSSQVLISEQNSNSWFSNLPLVKQIKNLAESANPTLKGEDRDRINILLLGMGGKNHDGAYLTDTIMLVSLKPSTKQVAMVSIPRDLVIPVEDMGWRKINNINAFAEADKPGSGGLATSQAVSDILGIPVDYFIRVDFDGFINIIDDLGGVDVDVENTFDDYYYPIMGMENAEPYSARYEHLHFDKGWTHMDGATALKFARSRHAAGVEGSDFARARRQQKIMEAVKTKLLSMNTLLNPGLITNIIGQVTDHVSTNLQIWEMLKLWNMFKGVKSDQIINKVLDNSPNGLLVDSISSEGAYILTPRSGDFSEIQYMVKNIFNDKAQTNTTSNVVKEKATIEIKNGTWINGLASQMAVDLENDGFDVVRVGNSSRQNFQKSVIYDLTYGAKKDALAMLKSVTNANVSNGLPDWLVQEIKNEVANVQNPVQPDFILILGQDADKTASGEVNPDISGPGAVSPVVTGGN